MRKSGEATDSLKRNGLLKRYFNSIDIAETFVACVYEVIFFLPCSVGEFSYADVRTAIEKLDKKIKIEEVGQDRGRNLRVVIVRDATRRTVPYSKQGKNQYGGMMYPPIKPAPRKQYSAFQYLRGHRRSGDN
ncbi:Uncharacterised protein r2_g2706 [Pycnogonum litorale]